VIQLSKTLFVRMLVPLPFPVFFKRFWPTEEQAACVKYDTLNLKLWLEADTLSDWHPPVDTVEELKQQHSHPTAGSVHIECELLSISEELTQHIFKHPQAGLIGHPEHEEPCDPLNQEHESLGQLVFEKTCLVVNRFLTFARAYTGQYCCIELPQKNRYSFFWEAGTKISENCKDWKPWIPPPSSQMLTVFGYHCVRNIDESNWSELCDFLKSKKKPDLVLDLLANADELAYRGHLRTSVFEAVSALEVCISNFVESPKLTLLSRVNDRPVRAEKLSLLFKKLGLRNSMDHLFPLYFTEKEMPRDVLSDCQCAIGIRNNIAHQGQRKLDQEDVKKHLSSIRSFCEMLDGFID